MAKIIVTMVVFDSFNTLAALQSRMGEQFELPKNSQQEGIHIATVFDDGQWDTIQHALVVVVGDVKDKWEVRRTDRSRTVGSADREVITVAFEHGAIPLLIDGQESDGDLDFHSLYSPRLRCIRVEKDAQRQGTT